jgi:transaldolase
MTQVSAPTAYKSPLHEMTQATPTCLWNDSASIHELIYSMGHGAVGATCNPVIVHGVLNKEMSLWEERIHALIQEQPTATEGTIAWQLVREVSVKGANLLRPVFEAQGAVTDGFRSRPIRASIATPGRSCSRWRNSTSLRRI